MNVPDCLFCKIVRKEIPAKIVYEDDQILAFEDIHPQAPVHILIIPKEHISTTNELSENNAHIIGRMALQASIIAKEKNIQDNGYRLIMNCNEHGGQTVYHIHLHLIGGRKMTWPPG